MAYTLLAIGPENAAADRAWLKNPKIGRVMRQPSSAVAGKRFGSRVFGIGIDSLLLALRTLRPGIKGPYLANNPWIGAALRVTGRKNFVVTGIYAEPTSRSWRVLRRLLGDALVIALSESEVGPWNAAGGRANAVLYGNTFSYPAKCASQMFHVFVGGSSDRSPEAIRALEEEVLTSNSPVRLTLATGELASEKVSGENVVSRPGPLNQRDFGALMSTASIVFLPLLDGTRAAGHMVLVGAAESGIPVAVTPSRGMAEYVVDPAVSLCDADGPLLPQLQAISLSRMEQAASIRRLWNDTFSLDAYVARVCSLLRS
ncbi:hypothetical protein AB0N24_22730 [Arthrobacter sp. NPDC093128]|uniref:hypothetical protein n=1 Tax=Arthrobacter sp. NPDC093128 TaxID=3154979 RepID=UPI003415CFD4